MPAEHRYSILLQILARQHTSRITVREVRDALLVHSADTPVDKATLRRWVNRKFATLIKQGWMVKQDNIASGKAFYQLTARFTAPNDDCLTQSSAKSKPGSLNSLELELSQYRRTMVSQLCEIEEYQRVRDAYPDLGDLAESQFHDALEENYRLLGRVKALEKILANIDVAAQ